MDREGRRRWSRRGRNAGQSLGLESLEGRAVPAVTAAALGVQLVVSGDAFDSTITISRDGGPGQDVLDGGRGHNHLL